MRKGYGVLFCIFFFFLLEDFYCFGVFCTDNLFLLPSCLFFLVFLQLPLIFPLLFPFPFIICILTNVLPLPFPLSYQLFFHCLMFFIYPLYILLFLLSHLTIQTNLFSHLLSSPSEHPIFSRPHSHVKCFGSGPRCDWRGSGCYRLHSALPPHHLRQIPHQTQRSIAHTITYTCIHEQSSKYTHINIDTVILWRTVHTAHIHIQLHNATLTVIIYFILAVDVSAKSFHL